VKTSCLAKGPLTNNNGLCVYDQTLIVFGIRAVVTGQHSEPTFSQSYAVIITPNGIVQDVTSFTKTDINIIVIIYRLEII